MAGNWKSLTNPHTFAVDTTLLLTDGCVMCHEYDTPNWHKLVPDAKGKYLNGQWQSMTPMPANAPLSQGGPVDAPLYFASAVLKDGRVFVAGGEYNSGVNVDLLTSETYDPVADSWTSFAPPASYVKVGDDASCVLPDGRVLLGNIDTQETQILDPRTKTWSAGGNKDDSTSEEAWTLLPDNTILSAEVNNHPKAEKYLIKTNTWVSAGTTPPGHDLVLNVPGISIEIGPAILMPDKRVFAIGATGHTALYMPPANPAHPGAWAPGPDFPVDGGGNLMRAFDAPACLLPNGKVLCVAGRVITSGPDAGWAGEPSSFFEFDGVALTAVPGPINGADNVPTYNCRLLMLPTGQALFSNCTNDLQLYTPVGGPKPAWRPHVDSVPKVLRHGRNYRLRGRQLNGLSQANSYGDDCQNATNYPLVLLHKVGGQKRYFCRTFDHSTMEVATGSKIHHTHFHVPHTVPPGHYHLMAIANGIHSKPVKVHVKP